MMGQKTRRKAEEMKAVGFFRKPVDGTALLDAIDWALRSSSIGRQSQEDVEQMKAVERAVRIASQRCWEEGCYIN